MSWNFCSETVNGKKRKFEGRILRASEIENEIFKIP